MSVNAKKITDWEISSLAMMGFGVMEGSTARSVTPKNNPIQERPTPRGEDIAWTAWKHADVGFKRLNDNISKKISYTRKYEDLAQVGSRKDLVDALGDHYAKQTEADVEAEFDKTKIRYVGGSTTSGTFYTNGTATITCTSQLNDYHVQRMVDYLYGTLKADYYDGDNFVCVCSVDAANGIYNAVEDIIKYTKYPASGEVGRYYSCRFVKTNSPSVSNAMGASSAYGEAYMFGKGTVMYGMAVAMKIIPKEITDFNRSRGLAWYDIVGFKIKKELDPDASIVKFTSA